MAAIIDNIEPQPVGYAQVEKGDIVSIVFGGHASPGMLPIFRQFPDYNPAFERLKPDPMLVLGKDKVTFNYQKELIKGALESLKGSKKHRARSAALEKITGLYGINNGLLTLIVLAKLIEEISTQIDLSPQLKGFSMLMKKYTARVDKIEAFTDEDALYNYDPEDDD